MSISSGPDTSSRVTARYWIETARSTAEAAVSGIPLAEYARGHRELAEALTAFGR